MKLSLVLSAKHDWNSKLYGIWKRLRNFYSLRIIPIRQAQIDSLQQIWWSNHTEWKYSSQEESFRSSNLSEWRF